MEGMRQVVLGVIRAALEKSEWWEFIDEWVRVEIINVTCFQTFQRIYSKSYLPHRSLATGSHFSCLLVSPSHLSMAALHNIIMK